MIDLKMKTRDIIFISLGVTLSNYIIESQSILGILSLFLSFVFMFAWINFIIYKLTKADCKKRHKYLSEIYFTIMLIASLLLLSTVIIGYSLGMIPSTIMLFIISPLKGFRFLLRPYGLWLTLCTIFSYALLFVTRKITR